jgi:hypothetical protein
MGDRSEDLRTRRLSDRALRERGQLPLSLLLEVTVPLERMRAVAHELNVAPKGFRVEKAPASALAPALAECKEPKDLDRVVALLFESEALALHPGVLDLQHPELRRRQGAGVDPRAGVASLRVEEGERVVGERHGHLGAPPRVPGRARLDLDGVARGAGVEGACFDPGARGVERAHELTVMPMSPSQVSPPLAPIALYRWLHSLALLSSPLLLGPKMALPPESPCA